MFARQIEKSSQLEKVFRDYQTDCIRNKTKYKHYKVRRKRIDTHLGIALVLTNRKKQQQQAAGAMGLVANGKGTHEGVCGPWKRNGACPKCMIADTFIHKIRKAKEKGRKKEKVKEKEKKKPKTKEKEKRRKEKTGPAKVHGLAQTIGNSDGEKIKEIRAPKEKGKEKKKEDDGEKEKGKVKARVKAKRGEENDHNPRIAHQSARIGTRILAHLAITAVLIIHQIARIGLTDGANGIKNADLDTNRV